MEEKKQNRLLIPLIVVVVILIIVVVGLVVALQGRNAPSEPSTEPVSDHSSGGSNLVLDYAQGVTVVDDESALQDAVDKMFEDAENEMVASYQSQAISEDGETFTCYIANSEYNEYDMFIALYTDLEEDPVYLSGLMRPGEAFREITLDRTLDKGTYTAYLAFTQVEDDHSTIHGQSVVTIELQVN